MTSPTAAPPGKPPDASKLAASVVVCTHNGGHLIANAVESLLAQRLPAKDFEVVLVDNASTDSTPQVLEDLARRSPDRVRAVREPVLGLSSGRNRGVLASRGEVIAFTDDDSRVAPDWLSLLVDACSRGDVWCAGGPALPKLEGELPDWVTPRLQCYLSIWDKGDKEVELHYNEYPRGNNMAYARAAFEAVGLFLTCFGRRGRSLMSYEEIELGWRIERLGKRILFVPGASVRHIIETRRISPEWFERRFYWQGRSEAYFDLIHRGLRFVLGRCREHKRSAAEEARRAAAARGGDDLFARCYDRFRAGYSVGAARGWFTALPLRARPRPYRRPTPASA